jgi:perosamine synthetase
MIPLCIPEIQGNEWKYIKECLDTNWVSSSGAYVNKFEDDFKEFIHAEKAVVTMNGTAALQLALEALNIGAGDEVIVSSMTFISPVNAIKYVGAKPVFVDICNDTWVMDAEKIEKLITQKTKAILPIHIYGNAVDMDKVMELAKKYNLYVIEDATESLGGKYKEKYLGTIGDIGCFSFNGNKLITTGAGGMLVTNDIQLGDRAKYLSTQTKTLLDSGAFYHEEVGYNFRLPNILAAMGCAQLENADAYLKAKIEHAQMYNTLLIDLDGIRLPVQNNDVENAYWLYSIVIEDNYPISRDELIFKFKEKNIETRPFFMPVHEMPPYKNCKHGDMRVTQCITKKGINLPSSVSLNDEDIKIICEIIKQIK